MFVGEGPLELARDVVELDRDVGCSRYGVADLESGSGRVGKGLMEHEYLGQVARAARLDSAAGGVVGDHLVLQDVVACRS